MKSVKLPKLDKTVGQLALGAGPFGGIYGGTEIEECGKTLANAIKETFHFSYLSSLLDGPVLTP